MDRKSAFLLLIATNLALVGCSAQYPSNGVQFCLTSIDEMEELKAVLSSVSETYGLSLIDSSSEIKNDLRRIENPLSRHPILYILIKDEGWFPKSGPVMINNIGGSSPQEVQVSFFRSTSWLGSDKMTDEIMRDLVSALSKNWTLSNYPGFKHEAETSLC